VKPTAKTRPEVEVKKTKHLTGSQREKYIRVIDQFQEIGILFRVTWKMDMKTNDTPQDAGNQNRRGFLETGQHR
jgi:hypothetical protein